MSRIAGLLTLICVLGCAACAQTPEDQSETIKALVQEVNELKARLAAVESKQQGQSVGEPAMQSMAASASVPAQSVMAETAPVVHGIKFQGFGEISYKADDLPGRRLGSFGFSGGPNGNFAVGDFDLFLTSQINDKTSVLSEIVFGEDDAQHFDVDLERVLLNYNANQYLKMSFGRFHTATSYYNSVFHSGKWLQTPVDRPLVVEFANDGGLLPTQAVGLSMTGEIPSGKLGLNYIFEYGTSDTIRPRIDAPAAEIDESNGNGVTAGVFGKPDWLPNSRFGASLYHDRLSPADQPFAVNQTIASVHAVYVSPRVEFINEGFVIRHSVAGTNLTFNTPAFYTLLSRSFNERWRPYFMYQYANASVRSPLFPDVGLRHGPTAGLRYDFNPFVGMKLQYEHTMRRELSSINRVATQLAFRF